MTTYTKLTVLIPCLNEADTIAACISKAKKYFQVSGISGEILVADNGSVDGSASISRQHGARVITIAEKGYGSALMGGINAAKGEYIIIGDADDSYDFSQLQSFVDALESGYDLVMGNRFKGGIMPGAMPWLHRYLGNPVLSGLGRLLFCNQVSDFHSGMRGFRRDAISALKLQTTGMEFASEMVVKASLQGLKITEVPVILYPDGRSRPPHLRTWVDGWRHLRFLLLYSPRWLFLYPGIFLIISGLFISIWLLPGPRQIGKLTFDINTLMYFSFLVIVGLQAVIFALFTQIYSYTAGFLPTNQKIIKLLSIASLEKGMILGFSLMVLGLASSLGALVYWGTHDFGPIEPTISMRLVIPGTVLFTCGFQIIFSSFFLGFMVMKKK